MQKQSLEFKGHEKTQEKLRGFEQNDDIGFLYLEFPHVRMQAIFAIKQPDLEIEPPLQQYQSIVIVMQPWKFFFFSQTRTKRPVNRSLHPYKRRRSISSTSDFELR